MLARNRPPRSGGRQTRDGLPPAVSVHGFADRLFHPPAVVVGIHDLLGVLWVEEGNLNLVEVTINRLRRNLECFGARRIDATPHGYELICDS